MGNEKKNYKPRKPKVKEIDMTDKQLEAIGKIRIGDKIYNLSKEAEKMRAYTSGEFKTGGLIKKKMKKPRGVGAALRGFGKACK